VAALEIFVFTAITLRALRPRSLSEATTNARRSVPKSEHSRSVEKIRDICQALNWERARMGQAASNQRLFIRR